MGMIRFVQRSINIPCFGIRTGSVELICAGFRCQSRAVLIIAQFIVDGDRIILFSVFCQRTRLQVIALQYLLRGIRLTSQGGKCGSGFIVLTRDLIANRCIIHRGVIGCMGLICFIQRGIDGIGLGIRTIVV